MSEENALKGPSEPDEKSANTLLQDDVVQQKAARAHTKTEAGLKLAEPEVPPKKRKTRRGKSKRRHPYTNTGRSKSNKMVKPEAPYNSNQFLLEDHGNIGLDLGRERRNSARSRTRDSSFSMDSEGEFYSSPDDEGQFLFKDFVRQYENIQAERLQTMSKDELIQEYLTLERKVESLTKRLRKYGLMDESSEMDESDQMEETDQIEEETDLQEEIERLTVENEALKRENAILRSKPGSSDSADSETDSDDSCSSTSSSSRSSSKAASPLVDYTQTNGDSTNLESV